MPRRSHPFLSDASRGALIEMCAESEGRLAGLRVLALINGTELFGHERGNIEVFKSLRRQGAEVIAGVNAWNDGGAVAEELSRVGFELRKIPFGTHWSKTFFRRDPHLILRNIWSTIRCSASVLRTIRSWSPSHMHIGSPLVYSYIAPVLHTRGLRVVYRLGDCPPKDSPANLALWRLATRRADRIVSISEFVRNSAIREGIREERIRTIYNLAPNSAEHEPSKPDPNYDSGTITYVGSLAENKGILQLIEAIFLLREDFPSIKLDLYGSSIFDQQFRSRVASLVEAMGLDDRILLHEHRSRPEECYRGAALHVAPSLWDEPLGNVVLEAKSAGLASVVFPSGGLPEMIDHKVNGYICKERTAASLADALRWMLQSQDRLSEMGEAALSDSLARFGRERFDSGWADIYE